MRLSCSGCCLLLSSLLFVLLKPSLSIKKSYVVYLGGHSNEEEMSEFYRNQVKELHYDFLASYVGSRDHAKDAILYSYTRHINGFAAILDEETAADISKHPNVITIFPNKGRKLHTTRSWMFLGLENNGVVPPDSIWKKAGFGEDVIIANLDTGQFHSYQNFWFYYF
ncbi:hypothetical protein Cgig2_032645 [Carnegiea gigantea]|uniref:Inhibitor I9 domain-containing protein n=1 Tax=Carnegiea gigantea TaxID=171969 RepID=A0A9Q1GU61_9CARY|nr:hypothetical protein Cgig2_032645 [Carnegiea gigantea]